MDAPMVVIPTASGQEYPDPERVTRFLTRLGATNVSMVHTTDPTIADTEEFVKPIREARGVWFGGGRQWRIVDAYGGTLAETEFRKVLERGGVIGGSSAGATIQGSYLLGIGLDENTAIVVQGNTMEVIGQSYVAIFDYTLWEQNLMDDTDPLSENGGKFFLLAPGDKYDLYRRKAIHLVGTDRGVPARE